MYLAAAISGLVKRVYAASGRDNVVPAVAEQFRDEFQDTLVVVDHKNGLLTVWGAGRLVHWRTSLRSRQRVAGQYVGTETALGRGEPFLLSHVLKGAVQILINSRYYPVFGSAINVMPVGNRPPGSHDCASRRARAITIAPYGTPRRTPPGLDSPADESTMSALEWQESCGNLIQLYQPAL